MADATGRVKRARLALSALLLLIVGASALASCGARTGLDNPCDGKDLPPIECGVGACRIIIPACGADGLPATCTPPKAQADETCDGIDNNCDGNVDDGCVCMEGTKQGCYTGSPVTRSVGLCHDGMQVCKNGGWGDCIEDLVPAPEVCDGLDNNCNGVVDEGCP